MLERIVTGGQTGVDRAALDVALALGIPVGGWCPRGRRAEDGRIPRRYLLRETPSDRYAQRTAWNVRDSDATLILTIGELTRGTAFTHRMTSAMQRPVYVVDFARTRAISPVRRWLQRHNVQTLNIAGPRSSTSPEIYDLAVRFLERLLRTPPPGRLTPAARRPRAVSKRVRY
jgi:predicted Rossmann-fold nucleotide-binding protein